MKQEKETKKVKTKKVTKKEAKPKNNVVTIVILIIIIIATFSFTAYLIINNHKNKTNDKPNTEELLKEATVGNLTIKNSYITESSAIYDYNAMIVNTSSNLYHVESLYVIFTVDGKEVRGLLMEDETMSPNEERIISYGFAEDLNKMTDIRYEIKN